VSLPFNFIRLNLSLFSLALSLSLSLSGFDPAPPVPVKDTQPTKESTKKTQKETPQPPQQQHKQQPTPSSSRSTNSVKKDNRLLEPEEEEIEKLELLFGQGFIVADDFERRKGELVTAMKKRIQLNLETYVVLSLSLSLFLTHSFYHGILVKRNESELKPKKEKNANL